jgi:hypothetical protein
MSGNVAWVIGPRRDAEDEERTRLEDRLVVLGVKEILRVFVLTSGVGVLEP